MVSLMRIAWYAILMWFGAGSFFIFAGWEIGIIITQIGLIGTLALIGALLLFVANLFRRAKLYRYSLLSLMLLVIMLSTIVLKVYLAPLI